MFYQSQKAGRLTFRCFNRKGWSLFGCLGREVRIGVLSVATLGSATSCVQVAAAPLVRSAEACEVEEVEADSLLLGEATVTASRAPLPADVAARQVVTLSAETLAAAGVTCVNDALKLSAGIDVRQRGAFGVQTDISIGGGTFDQITLMVNGIPVVNPQTGHNAADFPLNLSDVERIEIIEGAASRVLGTQAFSGAVNVVTRRGGGSKLSVQLEGGSYGTFRTEVRTALSPFKRFRSSLSASWQRSDGVVKNGDFEGGKAYWQGGYDDDLLSLDLQAGVSILDFGANTFYSAAYPDQWESTRRYLVSARAETKGRVRFAPQVSWLRNVDHFQLVRHSSVGENFHRGDVFAAGVNAWTDWSLGRTALGGEVRDEGIYSTNLGHLADEALQPGIPGGNGARYTKRDDRTNVSFHLEHNVFLGPVTVSAGVLAEHNSAIDYRFRFYPGVDVSCRPARAWILYASFNRSLRLPTFTDLWYKSPTQEGNAGLRPEECSAFRLGADFHMAGVSVKAKAHYVRGTNMIDWVMRSPDDIFHATNFQLDNYGIGADLSLRPTAWWGERFPVESLDLSYAWLSQHRRDGEPYFKSNYALEYLRHKFVARFTHAVCTRLSASWSLRLQQREGTYLVYEDLKPTGELRPYGTHALLDLRVQWREPKWQLYVDASNLTAHRYYDLAGVRQAGFVVMAGAKWNL